MKEELKNKIQGIKSTVKDAFDKQTSKVNTDQSKTDFNKTTDPLIRDKGLTGKNERKAS